MPQVDDGLDRVLTACAARQAQDLEDLLVLLRQPSISAQNVGVEACARLLRDEFEAAGFAARLLSTPGHPVLFADWLRAPGQPTVLVYGHYDVQPPEPLEAWLSPPFEPTIRDGKLFARGAGDNKGQIFAQLAGARAWLATVGWLPVNVKFLVEGEEETGSPHLASFVQNHRDLLAADLVYTSDGPVFDDAYPQVVYGVRGLVSIELRARGAGHDLHSGNWGGIAPNPAWTLVHLLSGYGGEGSKTVLPATATAKLDMRLVPDQEPDDIFAKVAAHVGRHAPNIELRRLGSMEPSYTPLEHPYAEIVRRAVTTGFGQRPLDVPLLGGSLPDAVFTKILGLPSFVVPCANADERNHAPNENIEVARIFQGIRTAAALFAYLAA